MNGPDGLEQREAEAQEQSWAEDERIEALEDSAESAIARMNDHFLNKVFDDLVFNG